MEEIKSLFKMVFAFAGKTDDYVCANRTMRHQSFDQLHPVCIKFLSIPPSHHTKNRIASALKGHVKMWHELITVGNDLYNFISKQIGFDRSDTIAVYSVNFI